METTEKKEVKEKKESRKKRREREKAESISKTISTEESTTAPDQDKKIKEAIKPATRGIILIAGGHAYYGKMAAALAASIRHHDKTIPILVYHAGYGINHLQHFEKNLFSEVKTLPEESYMHNGRAQYMKAKLSLYDLSPFDETIYLDVDMIWSTKKTVGELFDSLKDVPFTMISEGHYDLTSIKDETNKAYTFWGDTQAILNKYGENKTDGKLYQLRSEFIYFKKNALIKKYFDKAKEIYENPLIEVSRIAGGIPDEFAFNIAGFLLNVHPHKDKYSPVYWYYMHGKEMLYNRTELYQKYYAISIGGNRAPDDLKRLYNDLAKYYYNNLRLIYPFKLSDTTVKKSFLPERQDI